MGAFLSERQDVIAMDQIQTLPVFVSTVVLEAHACLSLFCLCWITTAGLSNDKRHCVSLIYLVRLCVFIFMDTCVSLAVRGQ